MESTRPRLASLLVVIGISLLGMEAARAHDIPNQRIDRSTQVTLRPGWLQVDYEVSLSELTLTQDLRSLVGSLPGSERSDWLARYGRVTGPLNAKGFLATCDEEPVALILKSFDLAVEEHPRYTFHFQAPLRSQGRLLIHDTNYTSSEGTSRLAVRACDGMVIEADDLPGDIDQIPVRPVWQLSDQEEQRTRRVEVAFHLTPRIRAEETQVPKPPGGIEADLLGVAPIAIPVPPERTEWGPARLASLLDDHGNRFWPVVLLVAAGLGAIHSIQPGHGKTLVTAVAIGPGVHWHQPALLGLTTALAHTGSVLLLAAILWWTGGSQVGGLHVALTRLAGFAIAACGFLRLGRGLGGWSHAHVDNSIVASDVALSTAGVIGLGLAGGMVPCWDAVGLVVLSAAIGRLEAGILLVAAFGCGMATVLVGLGLIASRVTRTRSFAAVRHPWTRSLDLISASMLAAIGLLFFWG